MRLPRLLSDDPVSLAREKSLQANQCFRVPPPVHLAAGDVECCLRRVLILREKLQKILKGGHAEVEVMSILRVWQTVGLCHLESRIRPEPSLFVVQRSLLLLQLSHKVTPHTASLLMPIEPQLALPQIVAGCIFLLAVLPELIQVRLIIPRRLLPLLCKLHAASQLERNLLPRPLLDLQLERLLQKPISLVVIRLRQLVRRRHALLREPDVHFRNPVLPLPGHQPLRLLLENLLRRSILLLRKIRRRLTKPRLAKPFPLRVFLQQLR